MDPKEPQKGRGMGFVMSEIPAELLELLRSGAAGMQTIGNLEDMQHIYPDLEAICEVINSHKVL